MALAVPRRTLDDMQGDADTKLTDFFECWGADMSTHLADKLDKICQAFMEKHAVTRVGALFRLRRAQAEAIFVECGAGEGWLTTLEELTGFKFASAPAPDSITLKALSRGTKPKAKDKYNPTLYDEVVENGQFDSERIPDYVFQGSTCAFPDVDTLKESDIERVTDRLLEYLASRHGKWNIGRPLARKYGKQLAAKFPNLPDYGKTDGRNREWWKMISDKCKNRTHKKYKSKLTINAVDLIDPDNFPHSKIASKVEIDEEETEQKFTAASSLDVLAAAASGAPTAEAATAEAAAAEAAAAEAAASELCEEQSSTGVLDFGTIVPTPASLSAPPPAPVPAAKPPVPAAKPLSPVGTGGEASKSKRRRPASVEQMSAYELEREENIKRNNEYLAGLNIEPLRPVKNQPAKKQVLPASELSTSNIVGATLAVPASFFNIESSKPDFWGYVGTVQQKVAKSDKPAYKVKFHDGPEEFYLNKHHNYTHKEIEHGVPERYLTNPALKVLKLAR